MQFKKKGGYGANTGNRRIFLNRNGESVYF